MELTKQDVCALQCAVLEAIGLNTDQIHASTDPGERRALDANITVYRKALAKLRAIEADSISEQPRIYNTRRYASIAAEDTLARLQNICHKSLHNGMKVWIADTKDEENAWSWLCELGMAEKVGTSLFKPVRAPF